MKFISQIKNYKSENDQEINDKKIILEYIEKFKNNILTRENKIAHMTSSGLILNKNCDKVLLIHHNIYNTWAWTGGHSDGEENLLETAIKEAMEETGIKNIIPLTEDILSIDILSVWGHIKREKYVSTHLHLNASFVLIADEKEKLEINTEETSGVKWISVNEIDKYSNEPFLIEIYFKLINRAKKAIV
jgi:8-oxo-dGTP pyrophosphatase MutT (NUDIX family)